ncbi:hypothetical protein AFI02nite_40660 [Aliivibrio fischeri]|uniref:Uncharacterized protein n=1 Tax=Aliivibrio fischeri TaxID=668 RepID=A0A510US20_ALIFS|nr:hypothetical protein AFI02nite_40660 [Aliivibrio fischeri]
MQEVLRAFLSQLYHVGIPVIKCADVKKSMQTTSFLLVSNKTSGETFVYSKIPINVYEIIQCGGLINFLQGV